MICQCDPTHGQSCPECDGTHADYESIMAEAPLAPHEHLFTSEKAATVTHTHPATIERWSAA